MTATTFSVTQIFSHFRFDRIVYVANAQYLYLIRRLSALRFSEESDDMGDLMTGQLFAPGSALNCKK